MDPVTGFHFENVIIYKQLRTIHTFMFQPLTIKTNQEKY